MPRLARGLFLSPGDPATQEHTVQDAHPNLTSPWAPLVHAAMRRGLSLTQAVDHVATLAAAAHRQHTRDAIADARVTPVTLAEAAR